MKKLYNNLEIHFEKCEDVILTSGEYLETDRSHIGTRTAENSLFNFIGYSQNTKRYNVSQASTSISDLYEM